MLKELITRAQKMVGLSPRAETEKQDLHMGEPGFLRKLVRPKSLESVFLFVTAKCNSKCRTCFYAGEMNKGEDLSFDVIRRLSQTAPRFDKLWLSGGEPVLRDDLVDIVSLFVAENGVKSINFPTNGLATDRIETAVEKLLERCPELTIHLNFSLDGLGATHDAVRGVRGAFRKTLATMDRLEKRYHGHPRLHRNAATVVTPPAYDEMEDLGRYLFTKYHLATQFFEAMRGEVRDPAVGRLDRARLEALHHRLMPLYLAMARRLFDKLPPGGRHLAELYFLGMMRFLYRIQEQNVEGPHPWPMDCMAGKTTLVIDHNGDFRSCELRPPIGNLRDYDYDLGAAMRSVAMRDEVAAIGGGHRANCFCTHTCWMLSSLKFSPRVLLYDVPREYFALRREGHSPFDPATFDLGPLEQKHLGPNRRAPAPDPVARLASQAAP